MASEPPQDKGTVQLNMGALFSEVVELVGRDEADRLWKENGLDTDEHWPGKWAKAMEVVENVRSTMGDQ